MLRNCLIAFNGLLPVLCIIVFQYLTKNNTIFTQLSSDDLRDTQHKFQNANSKLGLLFEVLSHYKNYMSIFHIVMDLTTVYGFLFLPFHLQVIIIVFLTGSLSLVTVVGNILVLVSFKINKALKTVNNYYLLSLAFADLTIGTLSMNLYTTYIIMDQWALGPVVCDLWLAIDYVASNASVMNLLVISFDR